METALDDLTQAVRAAHPEVPSRFAAEPEEAALALGRVRWMLPATHRVPPTPARWRLLGLGLLRGDPLGDALATEFARDGEGRSWGRFEQALAQGGRGLTGAPPALRAFFDAARARPGWVDPDQVVEGARVCALGGEPAMTAMLVNALAAGYRLSAINPTLIATGQLEHDSGRRLGLTTRWFMQVTRAGDLGPDSGGFQSTLRVRLIHALVRRRLHDQGWDTARLGVPVNQTDMQVTSLGFSAVYLLGMRMLGTVTTRDERQAYLHRWRVISWLMGVEDAYLHPAGDDPDAALQLLCHNVLQQPQADETTVRLARPLLLEEPLQRAYRSGGWLRGRFNRRKGLSIASLSLGRAGMAAMGLPLGALPWYPLGLYAWRQVQHRTLRQLPGGRDRLIAGGRQEQERVLAEVDPGTAFDRPDVAHG